MDKLNRTHQFILLVAFFVLIVPSLAWSQATTSIQGTVMDPNGVLVSGAKVTLENIGTSASGTETTDQYGRYQFVQLAPGTYRIRAERTGFKSVTRKDIHLLVNSPFTLPLTFTEPGPIEIIVDVSDTPLPTINTVDASIGNTIENSQITALPLEARNVAGLLSIQPGVVYTGIDDPVVPDTRSGAVNGARSDQTNITLDGVDVNDQQTGEAFKSVLPVTLDSIQEFRVVTVNGTANQGRSSGGQVSLITRSGTNAFHGAFYENLRNTATSANTFFNNSTVDPMTGKTIERPKLNRHVFGGALGGPIKKNRLFFFFNFEDTVTRQEESQLRIVPSEKLRNGTLRYIDTIGDLREVSTEEWKTLDPLGLGPNPAVLSLWKQYPIGNDPTQGGDDGLNFVGFRFNAPRNENKPSYIGRVDYTNSDHTQKIFARGALADWKEDETSPQFPGQSAARVLLTDSAGVAIGHTWNLSPRLVNDFRWGFTRQALDYTDGTVGADLAFRGIDSLQNLSARNKGRRIPTHNFTEDLTWDHGVHTLQFGVNFRSIHNKRYSEEKTYPLYQTNLGFMENFGFDALPEDIDPNSQVSSYVDAQLALLGIISQAEATYFVNRDGSIFSTPHVSKREFINNEFEWYAQDQWKIGRQWTITAGLRYSYFAPPYEKNGLQVRPTVDLHAWFEDRRDRGAAGIPSNVNPLLSFVPGGKANHAPTYFDPDKNNFAPRLGVAWSPSFSEGLLHTVFGNSGQSSIRFGASLVYDRMGGALPVLLDLNGAFGLTAPGTSPQPDYFTAPRYSGQQNLSSITPGPPSGVGFPMTPDFSFNGSLVNGFQVDPKLRTPYATTLSFSASREVSRDFTVEAAYVGRIAKKLLVQADYAAPLVNFKDSNSGQTWVEATGILSDLLNREVDISEVPPIPLFENVFAPMASPGVSPTQAFYEHMQNFGLSWADALHALDLEDGYTIYDKYAFFQQQFDGLPTLTNLGQSSYHSLQLLVRKRFGHGFQADFNYTLSKTLDNGSSTETEGQWAGMLINAFNHRQSSSYSDFDIRHQINSNFVLDLPIGRNRMFFGNMSPTMDTLLGGWRLSGLLRWRTGFPFANASGNGFYFPTNFFVNGPPTLKTGALPPKTKVTKNAEGGPNIFADPDKAYDAFEYTRSGFSGSRNALHGPGFFTLDTGVQKSFKLGESREIQFRWETFNLMNTVNFDGRAYAVSNDGVDFDLQRKSSFGHLRSLAGSPRVMQFSLRYQF